VRGGVEVTIHYEQRDHIALITIDRPETRGAMNNEAYSQLASAWRTIASTKSVRVAVITGVGDSYCAGADLKELIPEVTSSARAGFSDGGLVSGGLEGMPDGQLAVLRDVEFPKPIIAAVNGPCVASGMEMLLGTDIRLASPDAIFGLPEVCRGLFALGGSTVRLPRQVPYARAMEVLLTGRRFSAEEAERMGLINRIVEKPRLLDSAMTIAEMIAVNSPVAVSATKMSVVDGLKVDVGEAYAVERKYGAAVFASDDAIEGPRAFLEKRAPKWSDL
jgi:enoyl-CoA hydratase